jgi:hypothetical protein
MQYVLLLDDLRTLLRLHFVNRIWVIPISDIPPSQYRFLNEFLIENVQRIRCPFYEVGRKFTICRWSERFHEQVMTAFEFRDFRIK